MHNIYNALSLLFAVVVIVGQQSPNRLNVSVYYEALCPDSVQFFTAQLKDAYPVIGDRIHLDFVPYGKASQAKYNGRWAFACHHGAHECYANQVQACAVHQPITQAAKVTFLVCMMSGSRYMMNQPNHIQACAQASGMPLESLYDCMRGDLKDTLLAQHGDRTRAVYPAITFVPTVAFDNVHDPYKQNGALYDFLGTVCELLDAPKPSHCHHRQARRPYWYSYY